jgi:hypothetical protein
MLDNDVRRDEAYIWNMMNLQGDIDSMEAEKIA